MKKDLATFYYCEYVDGKIIKTITTGTIQMMFSGGIIAVWSKFPNGKCIASENIIEMI
jgi:hypothetical protein